MAEQHPFNEHVIILLEVQVLAALAHRALSAPNLALGYLREARVLGLICIVTED